MAKYIIYEYAYQSYLSVKTQTNNVKAIYNAYVFKYVETLEYFHFSIIITTKRSSLILFISSPVQKRLFIKFHLFLSI